MSKRCKKYSKTKSKSRTRKGGGLVSSALWKKYIELEEMSKKIQDKDELKKFSETELVPAYDAWDAEKTAEAKAAAEQAAAEQAAAEQAAAEQAAAEASGGKSRRRRRRVRRSRRNVTNKKYKKACKSRRANRRHSRKH